MEAAQVAPQPGPGPPGFVVWFFSLFAKACGDTNADGTREGRRALVRIAGDLLSHCSVHLATQVRGSRHERRRRRSCLVSCVCLRVRTHMFVCAAAVSYKNKFALLLDWFVTCATTDSRFVCYARGVSFIVWAESTYRCSVLYCAASPPARVMYYTMVSEGYSKACRYQLVLWAVCRTSSFYRKT